ncbi:hypothetical protein Leryth_005484 [Lithospermum erythrorhizon]|nr:hypothetical protein Leryth_005484 [Lithospermum erythrorhizon]
MSARRGGNKFVSAGASDSSSKGKNVAEMSTNAIDQLNQGLVGVTLDDGQNGDGWEVYSKKPKSKAGNNSGKQPVQHNSTTKAWGNPDTAQKLGMRGGTGSGRGGNTRNGLSTESKNSPGRGNGKVQQINHWNNGNPPVLTPAVPPLADGRGWSTRPVSDHSSSSLGHKNTVATVNPGNKDIKTDRSIDVDDDDDDIDYDDELLDDSDDDLLSDGYDSDASQKSLETRKKNRWFKELFECMDSLTVEQITDPERQFHCPVCKGGPGAIDWFPGLQAVVTHAKTKGSKRVKLHRELAKLLDEELRNRGSSAVAAGEFIGKWVAPGGGDKEIVWPPMVIIRNTHHDKDENEKWIGMGNPELLDYFSDYAASKASHSYGPQGHRGMSVLIFEASAVGYLEAARLSSDFENKVRDRAAWERCGLSAFHPGGKRQLFGYLADKKDLDFFNQHSQGKSKLKFEMKSHQEMVVKQFRQMGEDNQQLLRLKSKFSEAQKHSKALEETYGIVSEKLRKTLEENRIVRQKTKILHEQNKEEMDYQEKFFKEKLTLIEEARKEKEEYFEKIQQNERQKIKQNHEDPYLPEGNKPSYISSSINLADLPFFIFNSDLYFSPDLLLNSERKMSRISSVIKTRKWKHLSMQGTI